MIEANVEGARTELSRIMQLANVMRKRLETFQQADNAQTALGQPLTGPQKQAHLTQFLADRVAFDAKVADVATVIDAATVIDVDAGV